MSIDYAFLHGLVVCVAYKYAVDYLFQLFRLFVFLMFYFFDFFFFKQKTAYEMRISDWSSDVCSSDLLDKRLNYKRKMLAIAPMMDWTDTHCRVFHRLLAPHARLYTEMVHANAVIHGDRDRLLAMDPVEHPVALQLGGSEPGLLAQAARIGAELGFDEINLNCGCPSDRVQAGRFGACLMREP